MSAPDQVAVSESEFFCKAPWGLKAYGAWDVVVDGLKGSAIAQFRLLEGRAVIHHKEEGVLVVHDSLSEAQILMEILKESPLDPRPILEQNAWVLAEPEDGVMYVYGVADQKIEALILLP